MILYREKLRHLYTSSAVVKVQWTGHVCKIRKMRNSYRVFVENVPVEDQEEDGI